MGSPFGKAAVKQAPTPNGGKPAGISGPGSSKKYAPYHDTVLFVGDNRGSNGDVRSMLNADEKIKELTRILEARGQDQKKLAQELEDVQAEKVSMEYLLREKLEKLVQSEIEARLNTQKQPVAA